MRMRGRILEDRLLVLCARDHRRRLAFDRLWRDDLHVGAIFQPGQLVRVNLAGLSPRASCSRLRSPVPLPKLKQTLEQPPKYLVKLLFSFRGVTEVEVPADRIHAHK